MNTAATTGTSKSRIVPYSTPKLNKKTINFETMPLDSEYIWILGQGKNCRQFSFLTWNSFIGQFVRLVYRRGEDGVKGMERGNHYYSQLQVSLYWRT